jgi:hypothetical protein
MTGVLICYFIVAPILLRHDDLLTFTLSLSLSLGRSPFVMVPKLCNPLQFPLWTPMFVQILELSALTTILAT